MNFICLLQALQFASVSDCAFNSEYIFSYLQVFSEYDPFIQNMLQSLVFPQIL